MSDIPVELLRRINDIEKRLSRTEVIETPSGGGVGTVTSVGLAAPSEFTVSGSPVTTTGTLTLTKANQTANAVWAGPTMGGAAQPTFRALVTADLPAGTGTVTGTGVANQVAYWSGVSSIGGDAGFTFDPSTDTLTMQGGGVFNASSGATGDLIVNGDTIAGLLTVDVSADLIDITGNFRVRNNAAFFPEFSVAESTFGVGAQFLARYARGTLGSPTIVNNGDLIGAFLFQGYDGAAYQTSAFFSATVDTTPGAGDMPGAFHFFTTPNGSATAVEAMSIGSTQLVTVFQTTLGVEMMRLQTITTNSDPTESTFQNKVTTTNNSATTIATVAIPASTTVGIEVKVTVRRTGGVAGTAEDGGFFGKVAAWKNVAGTATQIGATTDIWADIESQAWSVTFTGSGANVLIQVTGTTSNNLSWVATYRTYPVST